MYSSTSFSIFPSVSCWLLTIAMKTAPVFETLLKTVLSPEGDVFWHKWNLSRQKALNPEKSLIYMMEASSAPVWVESLPSAATYALGSDK